VSGRPAVLLTGVGKRYDIVSAFARHAFVVAADPSPLAPAQYAADVRVAPPRADDPAYIPFLTELVERHDVCAVIPLTDLDLEHRERFTYGYHFGEGWQVDIKVEKVGAVEKGAFYPICLAGERAGPPEDCGGVEAFHDMISCIKEPHTDLGREWLEWLGPDYDPDRCDLAKINKAMKKLGK